MRNETIDLIAVVRDTVEGSTKSWPAFDGGEVDRKKVLSASEAIKCVRSLFLEKTVPADYDVDAGFNWGFAERGNSAEAWLVEKLRDFFVPEELLFAGSDQKSFRFGPLSATPDGLLQLDGENILLEVKSIDPRARLNGKPRASHAAQVKQSMFVVGKAIGFKVDYAVIIYLNANNYEEMQQFVVKPDPSFARGQLKKAEALFAKIDGATSENWLHLAASLPAEGLTNDSKDCDYCPFTSECSQIQKGVTTKPDAPVAPTELPKFLPKTIARSVNRYVDLKDERDALAAQVDELGNEIKKYMGAESADKVDTGKVTAALQKVAGRTTLDKAAVAADGIDLSKYEKVGKPSLRLRVERNDKS